jgi:hypothetical protein
MNAVRWIAIAFVLGLCAAYALWGGAPPVAPSVPSPSTVVKTAVSTDATAVVKKPEPPTPMPAGLGKSAVTLLKFEPSSVEFGEIAVGSSETRTVSLRNISDKTLQLDWAKGSCGCMKAELASQDLAPNAAAELKLTFSGLAGHRPEAYHAEVYVKDYEFPASVDVHAKVLQVFVAEPDALQFGAIAKGESKTLTTTLKRLDGQPFQIVNASIANKHDEIMLANPVEVPGSNKSAYTLGVTITGLQRVRLMVQAVAVTDVLIRPHDAKPVPGTIPVNIYADLGGDDVVVEKTVNSTLDEKGNLLPFEATLKRLSPGPLTVERIDDSQLSTVTYTTEKIDDVTLKLKITMNVNVKVRQPFGEFRIYTNNDKEPIRLPYSLPRKTGGN